MNRSQRKKLEKARVKKAKKLYKRKETDFMEVDLVKENNVPEGMTRCFRNNRYMVMIYDNSKTTKGNAIRALVQKLDNTPISNHWANLQKVKNKIFGKEAIAVEYYPKESELINDHSIYWLWVFPEGVLPEPIL